MYELDCILNLCLQNFLAFDSNKIILIASIATIIISFYYITKKEIRSRYKILAVYSHIFAILLPITFFGMNMACGGSLILDCGTRAVLYSIPLAAIITLITGYILMPLIYIKLNKGKRLTQGNIAKFIDKIAKKEGLGEIKTYLVDSAEPIALSYSSLISGQIVIVSAGVFDIFTSKEIESILLHEIGHIKNSSSFYKFSGVLTKFIPHISAFFEKGNENEERIADRFAIVHQRTKRYLSSAYEKMKEYHAQV